MVSGLDAICAIVVKYRRNATHVEKGFRGAIHMYS